MLATSQLLYTTLALTVVSFTSTLYVILRTLLPLVRPHVLSRYSRPSTPLPVYGYANPTPERRPLKSAQRFQCWLAFIDLSSCGVWLWEVIALASGSQNSPARMAFAICARPTVLLVVSLLSYMNVIRGKVVDLGRFDIIVWIPSVVLLAIMVSLAYAAPSASGTVWKAMMGVQTFLLCICTWCFGRLLLAVFRVRRQTVKSQFVRQQFVMEEKEYERQCQETERQQYERSLQYSPDGSTPVLPPIKTHRWAFSKTFLLAKASSAANTVSASLHRRSASGPHPGRPSTTTLGDNPPRPSMASAASSTDARRPGTADVNTPYGFLNYDPATTSRFGVINATSAATTNNTHEAAETATKRTTDANCEKQPSLDVARSIQFRHDARANSPAPTMDRFANMTSRMTFRPSSEEPRPSMGSYLTTDSASTETGGGVIGYLGGSRLLNASKNGLSKREAKKAGARMGGHLVGCVASWTLILPFLVYKMTSPMRAAPVYSTVLVALGISLSGPLLALQTIIAEGCWFRRDLPPLMASSSAVAFERLESRANTPGFTSYADGLAVASAGPSEPTSATTAEMPNTATTADTNMSGHRSNGSASSTSLSSMAAFSHPPPGVIRHSLDTQDAPTSILGKALSLASPHPKLQVLKAQTGTQDHRKSTESLQGDEEEGWGKRESRKLKSFSLRRDSVSRRRSNTITSMLVTRDDLEKANTTQGSIGRRSVLGIKDQNALTAQILAETEKKLTGSPSPTTSSSSTSMRSARSSLLHDRRASAPVTPASKRTTESGVLVDRQSPTDYTIDSMTASILPGLVPGIKIGRSSISNRNSFRAGLDKATTSTPDSSASFKKAKKPNLSLSLDKQDSHFTKFNEVVAMTSVDDAPRQTNETHDRNAASHVRTSSRDIHPSQSYSGHLRKRSLAGSGSLAASNPDFQLDDHHVTRRGVRKVTPTIVQIDVADDDDDDEGPVYTTMGPRPSLDDIDETSREAIEEDNEEVLSDKHSSHLLEPWSPQVLPDSPCVDVMPQSLHQESRPSIIVRTKTSTAGREEGSANSHAADEDDSNEIGTISMATRVSRTLSRRSSLSADLNLQRLSGISSSSSASSSSSNRHHHSGSMSSITSVGFRNMLSSNRNSWTGANFSFLDSTLSPVEAEHETSVNSKSNVDKNDTGEHPTAPLNIRDLNRNTADPRAGLECSKAKATKIVDGQLQGLSSSLSTTLPQDENAPNTPSNAAVQRRGLGSSRPTESATRAVRGSTTSNIKFIR